MDADEERRRIAEKRRKRYHSDPEFRERCRKASQRYYQRRKAMEPSPVEIFDEFLAVYEAKWRLDEMRKEGPSEATIEMEGS